MGAAVCKVTPKREFVMLGIILGSLFPDLDNYAVAVATVAKLNTHGLHRTFTHSIFTILPVFAICFIFARVRQEPRWTNFGIGFGVGIGLHLLLDLLVWFNGVAILWPIPSWVNLWSGVTPLAWFNKLMLKAEFLFFALSFLGLEALARKHDTDRDYLSKLRLWAWLQAGLFVVFTILAYTLQKGFIIPYGAVYLFSVGLASGVTIRMRKTLEWNRFTAK